MLLKMPKKNKYGNRAYDDFGNYQGSAAEKRRGAELELLQRAKEITGLKSQVKFMLIPSQKNEYGDVIERPVYYIADYVYADKDGKLHVEDVKGVHTKEYIIKRKLMLYIHQIRVEEIKA